MEKHSADFSKLTVPQLKAICKERKVSGYSKLGKSALIDKLRNLDSVAVNNDGLRSSDGAPPPATASSKPNGNTSVSDAHIRTKQTAATKERSSHLLTPPVRATSSPRPPSIATVRQVKDDAGNKATYLEIPREPQLQMTLSSQAMPPPSAAITNQARNVSASSDQSTGTKRPAKPLEVGLRKKSKIVQTALPASLQLSSITILPVLASSEKLSPTESVSATTGLGKENMPTLSRAVPNTVVHQSLSAGTSKRFKPLIAKKKPTSDVSLLLGQPASSSRVLGLLHNPVIPTPVPLRYLELSNSVNLPELCFITIPPPLQHRKRVQRWAIILSQINEDDCKRCVFVSKMFRYAVYLSAREKLRYGFPGARTADILEKHPAATTDFWPYLRLRRNEIKVRQAWYTRSFLASAIQKVTGLLPENVLSRSLWCCPNNERQINIALRFLLTRFWFAVSVGGTNASAWLSATVMDAQEVVPGEVWSISFSSFSEGSDCSPWPVTSTVYILEATCEVIGHAPACTRLDQNDSSSQEHLPLPSPIRADWSSYIHSALARKGSGSPSLLSKLKWAHQEEYKRGISRAWLARISQEGELGAAKRCVAERYVLACVVANSVSGTWMSTMDMAQEFAGMPNRYGLATTKMHHRDHVNLFLPAHHHVESVHFTTSGSAVLHAALAVVQTPGREYFILKDNGMEVGCEEDGVAPLWMEIIGCNSKGLPT